MRHGADTCLRHDNAGPRSESNNARNRISSRSVPVRDGDAERADASSMIVLLERLCS